MYTVCTAHTHAHITDARILLNIPNLEPLEVFPGVGEHSPEAVHGVVELVHFSSQTDFRWIANALAARTTTPIVKTTLTNLRS